MWWPSAHASVPVRAGACVADLPQVLEVDPVSDPTTVHEVESVIQEMTRRLRELTVEHREQCSVLGKARAAHEKAFLQAHLRSLVEHPQRRVDHHKTIAREAALEAYESLVIAEELEKAMRHEMHSIRQILVSQGTLGRFVADEAGHSTYGRRR